eukprot:6214248-Pleurochrysis_carterae.AAC.3
MAIPEKRQAGAFVLWLGVIFVAAAGVLCLPRESSSGGGSHPAHACTRHRHSGPAEALRLARACAWGLGRAALLDA